jgi:hypothetical protein
MSLRQILAALHPDHFQDAEEKIKAEEAFESKQRKMDIFRQRLLTSLQSCEAF